ncbi:mucin-5AC-like [Scomber japonicus]|uniref:mucin-5AC-like n=1 Tax=Scomber japonicus TaxID=13676 RepID=UPI00230521F7|nr:mucin-5AC-like [Scomber japonicus]
MEEREALKRQIDLLQNLINKHKSVHGDAPFTGVGQRHPEAPISAGGRGHTTSVSHPHSFRGKAYVPQSRGSWRKAYSLRNKNPESSVGGHSLASSSSVHQSSSHGLSNSTALPSQSRGEDSDRAKTATATLPSGVTQLKKEGHVVGIATINKVDQTSRKIATQQEDGQKGSSSAGKGIQHDVVLPGKKEKESSSSEAPTSIKTKTTTTTTTSTSTSTSLQKISQLQIKPSLTSKTSTETKQTIPTTTSANLTTIPTTPPPQSALSKVSKQAPMNPPKSAQTSHGPFLPKSKFTWVKNQSTGGGGGGGGSKQGSSISSPAKVAPTPGSKGGVSSPSATLSKKTPAKKLARKLSPVTIAPKTSKYKWVSSSAGAQAKTLRKPLSPKALTHPQRALDKGEATKKLKPGSTPSPKLKKGVGVSSSGSSLSTRYRWKAGGQKTSAAATGGAAMTRRRSAFHWTSERSNKGVKGGLVVSPTLPQRASVPSSSPGGFKLRSRMKIIRRSTSSGCGSEKSSSPSPLKLSPRARIYTLTRTPTGVRRTPSRELVSFGRHKLRRLSPTSARTTSVYMLPMPPAPPKHSGTHGAHYHHKGILQSSPLPLGSRYRADVYSAAAVVLLFYVAVSQSGLARFGICGQGGVTVLVWRLRSILHANHTGMAWRAERCKKKHTLVCPDFSKTGSCPRGARCKLQHRQRANKRNTNTSTTPAKKARTKELSKRPRLSVIIPPGSPAAPGTPVAGSLELPSFISLSSSPEEADAPDTLPAESSQVKEKKLQIKPRL